MGKDIQKLRDGLSAFDLTSEAISLDLRLDLSEILLSALRSKGWRQIDLARAAGMKPAYISRVLHSNQNVTFEVVARLLHALGATVSLTADRRSVGRTDDVSYTLTDTTYGEEIIEEVETDACNAADRTAQST